MIASITYKFLLLLHVFAAVVGIGQAFSFSTIMRSTKTVPQVRFSLGVLEKIEKTVKIGSVTLLLTGIIMAIMNPTLWTKSWFLASIAVYVAIQVNVIFFLKPLSEKQKQIIEEAKEQNDIPDTYIQLMKKNAPVFIFNDVCAVLLIFLMVWKPF